MSAEIQVRLRHENADVAQSTHKHPRFSHASSIWIGVGSAVLGAGVSLYGQNKQSKDQAGADGTNRAAIGQQDLNTWKAYLMQRGINPQGVTQYGQIPTNAAPQNSRLPLWANLSFQPQGTRQGSVVRRKTLR